MAHIKGRGWIKDKHDHRDKALFHQDFYRAQIAPRYVLPHRVDLRPHCPPVYDQGQMGSCTANAICGALKFGRRKFLGKEEDWEPARLYVYYNERVMENDVNLDNGAEIRDGIKSLGTYGVCPEADWPYPDVTIPFGSDEERNKWFLESAVNPPAVLMDPKTHQLNVAEWKQFLGTEFSYYRVADAMTAGMHTQDLADAPPMLQQLKKCLASGYPFVFGLQEYKGADLNTNIDKNGVLVDPPALFTDPPPEEIGGHAVLAVGYDDSKKAILIQNSWGAGWGTKTYPSGYKEWGADNPELFQKDPAMKGHFWMPYAWFERVYVDGKLVEHGDWKKLDGGKAQPVGYVSDFWVIEVQNVTT